MEVFAVPTPTYSGNCKPNLESFLVECIATRPKVFYQGCHADQLGVRAPEQRLKSLEGNADLLASCHIAVAEAIDLDDVGDQRANIVATTNAVSK